MNQSELELKYVSTEASVMSEYEGLVKYNTSEYVMIDPFEHLATSCFERNDMEFEML